MFSLILIIITSLLLLIKQLLKTTPVPSTLKMNAPSDKKKAIINNLISCAKLIFYQETKKT